MPQVSIIVPCYNEQATIRHLLEAILAQSFPRAQIEVIIADGMSTDRTRAEIAEFQRDHPDLALRVVDNPARSIPSGLNRAIGAARGEYLVRLDAHAKPAPDYVERSLAALQAGRGDNVGGLWQIEPGAQTWVARAIAVAAAHPLGVGGAQYRVGGAAQAVDTVPFGAFRRDLIERIGFFDETLLSNEDYEFNARIRKSGGAVWFDPAIRSTYFARASLKELARQYWRYGYWKFRMLCRYPETIRWRQGLPPLFFLSLFGLGLLAIVWPWLSWILLVELLLYLFALLLAGAQLSIRHRHVALLAGAPLAMVVMHTSWSLAFWWSLLSARRASSMRSTGE
jgi:glycosyltransferase involved in cell wall biosynthesis